MSNNCKHCTFSNEPNAKICGVCSKSINSIIESTMDEEQNGIQCDNCTFLNALEDYHCEICQMPLYFTCDSDLEEIIGNGGSEAAKSDNEIHENIVRSYVARNDRYNTH